MVDDIHSFADASRLSHLLWEVNARTMSFVEAGLVHSPLSIASAGVLDAINANPGISIADMARWLPTSAQAISRIVARLERLEFIERRLGTRGYGVALFITEAGAAARDDADQLVGRANLELAQALGQTEHDQLVRLLCHARVALESLEASPDDVSATQPG